MVLLIPAEWVVEVNEFPFLVSLYSILVLIYFISDLFSVGFCAVPTKQLWFMKFPTFWSCVCFGMIIGVFLLSAFETVRL